jgi:23S rRNA (cytosine1962-C5)-methyltransferase
MKSYHLLDSGHGRKFEQFGSVKLVRPCGAALWKPKLSEAEWRRADGVFLRDPENRWEKRDLPNSWELELDGLTFKLQATDFGHLGIFPEHSRFWPWMGSKIKAALPQGPVRVLNLFAYSGGATLAAARAGAQVCHLDASKGMVDWARENAKLNGLENAPIRWIVDDVLKFLRREVRRESRYEAIILDPPTFGRGKQGEMFKIEEHLPEVLSLCRQVLSERPLFLLFSCHTPGFSPLVMQNLLGDAFGGVKGTIDGGEMILPLSYQNVLAVPSGTFGRWEN